VQRHRQMKLAVQALCVPQMNLRLRQVSFERRLKFGNSCHQLHLEVHNLVNLLLRK
jgi:hypothetical protein